jgi:hypothetical protein
MPGGWLATLAVLRSEAELRLLEAASFNPRMLRRYATSARATLLAVTDFTIADGLFWQAGDAVCAETSEENKTSRHQKSLKSSEAQTAKIFPQIRVRDFLADPATGPRRQRIFSLKINAF